MIDTVVIMIEIAVAAMASVLVVLYAIHHNTVWMISKLSDTQLFTALNHNSKVTNDMRRELEILSKQLAALVNK